MPLWQWEEIQEVLRCYGAQWVNQSPPAAITIKFSSGSVPPVLDRPRSRSRRGAVFDAQRTSRANDRRVEQKFCCTGHRQQFWIAALDDESDSVDCLKASHTSVHAA